MRIDICSSYKNVQLFKVEEMKHRGSFRGPRPLELAKKVSKWPIVQRGGLNKMSYLALKSHFDNEWRTCFPFSKMIVKNPYYTICVTKNCQNRYINKYFSGPKPVFYMEYLSSIRSDPWAESIVSPENKPHVANNSSYHNLNNTFFPNVHNNFLLLEKHI